MRLVPSFTVHLDIYDVLYLSYMVPITRLRPFVPDALNFAVTLEDTSIISLVVFRSRNVRVSLLPFLRFKYDQANIRTYVVDPTTGKPSVFFLKSGITSPLVSVATGVLGIPWQHISIRIDTEHRDNEPSIYAAQGNWDGAFSVCINKDRSFLIDMTPFQTPEEAIRFLTGPSVGFYKSSSGVIRFEVEHSAIKPSMGTISAIHFPILTRMGLVTDDELPLSHSALVAPHGYFNVSMPPHNVSI